MKIFVLLILTMPLFCFSQEFDFQFEPEAFPVEIEGWQPFCPWAGGIDRTCPELCDLDSDEDLDFFTGSSTNWYWYFENIGNGLLPTFQYISSSFDSLLPICEGTMYSCIRFCDLNDDSLQDVIISNGIPGLIVNQGTANQWDFSGPLDTLRDHNGMDVWGTYMDFVDIDSDADYDLFTGFWDSQVHSIRLYENIGTSQEYDFYYVTQNWQNIQTNEGYEVPCFADLDADGDLDLLLGTGQGNIYYYRNDGTAQNAQMTLVTNNFCDIDVQDDASPELADLDGDGDLDLLVGRNPTAALSSQTQGDIYFYENIGTPQQYSFQFKTTNYLTYDCGEASVPSLIDIDADGDLDLFSRIAFNILFYRNQGSWDNPNFVYETSNFGNITVQTLIPWFCDIDSDGDYDLFCGTGTIPGPPGLYLYINQGTPENPNYVLYSNNLVPGVFSQSSVVIVPGTADIDADGDQDLFVSDDDDYFYYWENIGTPQHFQFQYVTNNWQDLFTVSGGHRYFCFYDIDRDDDLDLFITGVLVTGDWALSFYRNEGTPQSANMLLENDDLFPDLLIYQAAPYVVDIDLDSDGDLFVGDTWGGIRFFRNLEVNSVNREGETVNRSFSLLPNYPNPFNSKTAISYQLQADSYIKLAVYDMLGREVQLAVGSWQENMK